MTATLWLLITRATLQTLGRIAALRRAQEKVSEPATVPGRGRAWSPDAPPGVPVDLPKRPPARPPVPHELPEDDQEDDVARRPGGSPAGSVPPARPNPHRASESTVNPTTNKSKPFQAG